ncbi:MAG: FtsH protease activity modulator HflK [Desulfobacteraceae bacterium]|nr:MAG: FtsH protease activity modulator HflK [Desulfobacteraceae bacterium]
MAWDWEKLQQQRKTTGPKTPPQVGQVFDKIKGSRFKLPGFSFIIIGLIILYLATSTIYTVAVDEVGVIQRFGKYARTTGPGLNFKLPAGIEKLSKVKVRYVYKEEFGLRTLKADVRTRYAAGEQYLSESLMLTGDLNVAVVPWIVQYRVKDPYLYLFKVRNVRNTLRDLSEATMRLVVGDRSINEVISKREEIAVQAQTLLQKELDEAETGITVTTIEMKRTNVPEPVQPSFNEVNQATQDKEKMIYQAREAYNKAVPQARGDAEKTIREAEGYALDRVNRAKGDASRFLSLYQAYVQSEDVTRRRLYLEAIRDIFPKLGNKYIVDSDQKNLLPLLNLGRAKEGGDQ